MLFKNITKKFQNYSFRSNKFVIFSLVAFLFLSVCIFLKSYQNDIFSSPDKEKSHIVRLTRAGYWVTPASVAIRHSSKDAFVVNYQEQQCLVDWISTRYPVNSADTELFVSAAYLAAHEVGLDPHLILAVMAIESSFNPEAESPVGAQGLMQVMTKVHSKRFEPYGGAEVAKNPIVNIRVGTAILKEYISKGGSVKQGLKSYVGAAAYSHDFGYGAKVLAKYHRLKQVSSGKKLPILASASGHKKLVRSSTKKTL